MLLVNCKIAWHGMACVQCMVAWTFCKCNVFSPSFETLFITLAPPPPKKKKKKKKKKLLCWLYPTYPKNTPYPRSFFLLLHNFHKKSLEIFIKQFKEKIVHGLFSMFQACVSFSACIFYVFMNIYTGYVCINGHTAGGKKNYRPTYPIFQ